jgi:hypothetical protein
MNLFQGYLGFLFVHLDNIMGFMETAIRAYLKLRWKI